MNLSGYDQIVHTEIDMLELEFTWFNGRQVKNIVDDDLQVFWSALDGT